MKILQVHDYPPHEGGGIEVNVSKVSKEMVKAGHEVTIATSRFSSETFRTDEKEDHDRAIDVVYLDKEKQLKDLIDKVEIVHIHFTFSCRPASVLALEYCVERKKRCVFSIRTSPSHLPFSSLAKVSPLERDVMLKKIVKLLNSENVFISSPAKFMKGMLKEMGVDKKVHVIRNGVDFGKLDVEKDKKIDKVDITYIGEISMLKGVNYLVDAIRFLKENHPEIRARFIGGGSDKDQIEKMVEAFDLNNNIEFSGYLYNGDIPKHLVRTKMLVHPSLSETWGNVVAEALSLGVPVVTTGAEGLLEVTDQGNFAELFPVGDAKALKVIIERFLSEKKYRKNVKEKALKAQRFFKENYSIADQTENLLSLYSKIQNEK